MSNTIRSKSISAKKGNIQRVKKQSTVNKKKKITINKRENNSKYNPNLKYKSKNDTKVNIEKVKKNKIKKNKKEKVKKEKKKFSFKELKFNISKKIHDIKTKHIPKLKDKCIKFLINLLKWFNSILSIRIKNKTLYIIFLTKKIKIRLKSIAMFITIFSLVIFNLIQVEKSLRDPNIKVVTSMKLYPTSLNIIKYYNIETRENQKLIMAQEVVSSLKSRKFSNNEINQVIEQMDYEYEITGREYNKDILKLSLFFAVITFAFLIFKKTRNISVLTGLIFITMIIISFS